VESIDFYQDVLGFVPIRRPGSFNFDGAWYVNCLTPPALATRHCKDLKKLTL